MNEAFTEACKVARHFTHIAFRDGVLWVQVNGIEWRAR